MSEYNTPRPDRGFTVTDLSRRWRCGEDKIRGFINRGELVALNLATTRASKPQWRITQESVEKFEHCRSSVPPPKTQRRRRRHTPDYFADL